MQHSVRKHGLLTLALLGALLAILLTPSQARASQLVDVDASCTITIGECEVEGQRFTAYRVASMSEDGSLAAVEALADAVRSSGYDPATFSADTSAAVLDGAAQTFGGYVAANPDGFQSAAATSARGADGITARITGLKPGMYLVVASTVTAGDTTYVSKPYLISVPSTSDAGTYVYDRTVKAVKVNHSQEFENKVVKLWSGDTKATRPTSVTVQIYDGTSLYQTVKLNVDNGWSYAWTGKGDWSVREVVDSSWAYRTTISSSAREYVAKDGSEVLATTFSVTNAMTPPPPPEGPKRLPKTGDAANLPLIGGLTLVGTLCVIVGVFGGRRGDGN